MVNLEKIGEKIAQKQIEKPKVFLFTFLILNLLFLPGVFNLFGNVEASLERVLPQDINEVKLMNDMRTQFGADMVYLVFTTKDKQIQDLRNPQFIEYTSLLSKKLEQNEYILEAQGLHTLIVQDLELIPNNLYETKEYFSRNLQTSMYLNSNYDTAILSIRTDTGSSSKLIAQVLKSVNSEIEHLETLNPGVNVQVTGFSAIDKATFDIIISDFMIITLISMIGIGIIVYLTFGSFSKGMLPMIIVMNALIWTMGIVGYLGLTLTVVSMVSAAMIMGLGIDFGIHQVHSYFELRKTNKPEKSLKLVLSELLRAMLGASLTTIAGFLALLFGVLPAMKTLGIILAIGIFTTLIGAIFLLPVIIYQYDLSQIKKQTNNNKK